MIDPTGHEVNWNPGEPSDFDHDDPADSYVRWCELHACPFCDGVGEDWDDEVPWTCDHCDGTGLDPDAEYDGPMP